MNFNSRYFNFSTYAGPVLDKEMRVSSRRRRNYVLRSIYIILLLLIIILFWVEEVRYSGVNLYQASRMSEAGKAIVYVIVWFQFIVSQLLAIMMLSTSISDEVYHKTLGVLMTTPINSFQIVLGKLFSKLLQLLLLLAVSLPLLAIVRVFGGIPWDYIIKSLCIILSSVIFAGSISMFFSIFCRRAYAVVIISVLILGAIYLLLPILGVMYVEVTRSFNQYGRQLEMLFLNFHPFGTLGGLTASMMMPRGASPVIFWPGCCIGLLAVSACILTVSVILVRKVALRQITGQLDLIFVKKPRISKDGISKASSHIRKVSNLPLLWKEMRLPLLGRHKKIVLFCLTASLIILVLTYLFLWSEISLKNEEVHVMYMIIFMSLGMLFTLVIPATAVTSEKESGSWLLLLTTTQSDWQILWAKFFGVIRKCLPAWFFLFGHLIFFTLIGWINPATVVFMATIVVWIIVFLSSTGLYFSSRFRKTTTAVIMNFALAAFLWAFMPFVIALFGVITRSSEGFFGAYIDIIPFVQMVVVMTSNNYSGSLMGVQPENFNWPHGFENIEGTFILLQSIMIVYLLAAFLFLWRAKRCFRKRIF